MIFSDIFLFHVVDDERVFRLHRLHLQTVDLEDEVVFTDEVRHFRVYIQLDRFHQMLRGNLQLPIVLLKITTLMTGMLIKDEEVAIIVQSGHDEA